MQAPPPAGDAKARENFLMDIVPTLPSFPSGGLVAHRRSVTESRNKGAADVCEVCIDVDALQVAIFKNREGLRSCARAFLQYPRQEGVPRHVPRIETAFGV
mmetsp:Transcript_48434/g.135314  ORF Transcript_48434/g.135314 Transcript_48434/m.135314 type:complete len:101 (+) Transcript_48434:2-304(+)